MKKIVNGAFIGAIVLFLLMGFAKTLFFPEDISEAENRYANKIPAFTMESFLKGEFQEQVKDALGDQVPLATTMKNTYNYINSFFEKGLLALALDESESGYISYRGGLMYNDYLVYSMREFNKEKAGLDQRLARIKELSEKNPEIEFYLYYLENDTDILFGTNEKLGAYEYLEAQSATMNIPFTGLKINDFDDFKKYFYKTDHHWNCYGSYTAYESLVELMQLEDSMVSIKGEYVLDYEFSGSKARKLGANTLFTEKIPVYHYDFPEMVITVNDAPAADYGAQEAYINGTAAQISYGLYYGDDFGKTIFDTPNDEKENILVLGDSYDNALLKLIASHFNETHSIDLRHYENTFGHPFSFSDYVEENDIDKVVFIGDIDYFVAEVFEVED